MTLEHGDEYRTAVDKDAGAKMKIRNAGSQMEFLTANYSCPGAPNMEFSLELRNVRPGPNVVIYATDIERVFRTKGLTDREKKHGGSEANLKCAGRDRP